jgi:hypothetical protein
MGATDRPSLRRRIARQYSPSSLLPQHTVPPAHMAHATVVVHRVTATHSALQIAGQW